MLQSIKSMLLIIVAILIISFILPGCYTQLSRPRVDTEDEYYQKPEDQEEGEYYQDEGTENIDSERAGDVYIFNNYPYNSGGFYDFWYPNPYSWQDYYWNYSGPYPNYWWDPYAHWWVPGWYAGYYYDNYWRGGYHHYYDHYRQGYNSGTTKHYEQRPFARRSSKLVERNGRDIDSQRSFSKPSPNRIERPQPNLSNPKIKNRDLSPVRKNRTDTEGLDPRRPTKRTQGNDDAIPVKDTKPRTPKQQSMPSKDTPRPSKATPSPRVIETAPPKQKENSPTKNNSAPERSQRSSSSDDRSGNRQVSKPSTPSY